MTSISTDPSIAEATGLHKRSNEEVDGEQPAEPKRQRVDDNHSDSELDLDFDEHSESLSQPKYTSVEKEEYKDFFSWKTEHRKGKDPCNSENYAILAKNHVAAARYNASLPLTVQQFTQRFDHFTENVLTGVDWDNFVVSGGAVVACFVNDFKSPGHNLSTIFPNADIDIFSFGQSDSKELKNSSIRFMTTIQSNISLAGKGKCIFAETPFTYSLFSTTRPIQLLRRRFDSLESILSWFDVDCCGIAYQGPCKSHPSGRLISTKRAFDAILYKRNVVDMSRRSTSYEKRLIKYSQRGFAIWVPNANWPNIDKKLLQQMSTEHMHGCLQIAHYDQLCQEDPYLASTEKRARCVPFPVYSVTAFKKLFEEWQRSIEDHEYGRGVGLSHLYHFNDDLDTVISDNDDKWPKFQNRREASQHDWQPKYRAKPLKLLIKESDSQLSGIRQWSAASSNTFIESLFDAKEPAAELHTHLGGMGSYQFWLEDIMNVRMYFRDYEEKQTVANDGDKLPMVDWYGPRLSVQKSEDKIIKFWDSIRISDRFLSGPHVSSLTDQDNLLPSCEEENLSLTWWRVKLSSRILSAFVSNPDVSGVPFSATVREVIAPIPDKERLRWFLNLYTHQVILPASVLIESLGLQPNNFIGVCDLIGIRQDDLKAHIYFNTVEQLFEYTPHGINSRLLQQRVGEKKEYFNGFSRCFQFTDDKGNPPAESTLHLMFKDKFTPEFYPNRFLIRKTIFEQDLRSLSLLLRHTLLRYRSANVNYVEYSIGFADVVRPWVWPFLLLYRKNGSSYLDVEYRFLAGFSRGQTLIASPQGQLTSIGSLQKLKKWDQLEKFIILANNKTQEQLIEQKLISFENFIPQCEIFNSLYTYEHSYYGSNLLKKYVVGFDLFGDEKYAPFIPFENTTFREFGKLANIKSIENDASLIKRKFGFRVHCGEITVPSKSQDDSIFRYHMNIAVTSICSLVADGIPVRIGHGVAFAECINRKQENAYSFVSQLLNHNARKPNRSCAIAIEINPISNYQLLLNSCGESKTAEAISIAPHAMNILKERLLYLPIVIGTDDDGIFNKMEGRIASDDSPIIRSVAFQFWTLYKQSIISEREMKCFKRYSHFYSFGTHSTFVQLKKKVDHGRVDTLTDEDIMYFQKPSSSQP